jgi:tetratricopeptide (TPR) repeat protein
MVCVEKPRRILLGALLVFAAALALYAPFAPRELLWDDYYLVEHNAFAGDCANLGPAVNPLNLFRVLPVPMSARPVVNATLIADACAGGSIGGMHLTNSLLHAFNSVLVFLLILVLCGSGLPAFFGAMVFALHPASAETVHVITFRSHLLGFFFFTAGLTAVIFHSRKPNLLTAVMAAVCYLSAMLSVETAVVMPAAAFAAVYFESGKEGLGRIRPLMAALAFAAVFYLWFRIPRSGYAMPGVSSPGIPGFSFFYPKFLFPYAAHKTSQVSMVLPWRLIYENPVARLYTMSRVALDYLTAFPLPLYLNSDYNPPVITSAARGLWPLAANLAVTAAAVLLLVKRRLEGLGLALILITLLPVLNIWPIYNIKADRYLYLPLAGFAVVAAQIFVLITRAGRTPRFYLAGAAWLWAAALAFNSVGRIPDFRDNFSFFSAAVENGPSVPRARVNLAAMYMHSGNCPAALDQLGQATGTDSRNFQLKLLRAYALAKCGRRAEAAQEVDSIITKRPRWADALFLAGMLRLKSDSRAAKDFLQRALKADPDHPEARLTLMLAENRQSAGLGPADRRALKELKKYYRGIGLL